MVSILLEGKVMFFDFPEELINLRFLVSRQQYEHIAKLCPASHEQNIMSSPSRAKPNTVNVAFLSILESIKGDPSKDHQTFFSSCASATLG